MDFFEFTGKLLFDDVPELLFEKIPRDTEKTLDNISNAIDDFLGNQEQQNNDRYCIDNLDVVVLCNSGSRQHTLRGQHKENIYVFIQFYNGNISCIFDLDTVSIKRNTIVTGLGVLIIFMLILYFICVVVYGN